MLWVNTSSAAAWQCCHISSWGLRGSCAPQGCRHGLLCCYDVNQCSSPRSKQLTRCTHASTQHAHGRPATQGVQWGLSFNDGRRCCSHLIPLLQLKTRYEALKDATPKASPPWESAVLLFLHLKQLSKMTHSLKN